MTQKENLSAEFIAVLLKYPNLISYLTLADEEKIRDDIYTALKRLPE